VSGRVFFGVDCMFKVSFTHYIITFWWGNCLHNEFSANIFGHMLFGGLTSHCLCNCDPITLVTTLLKAYQLEAARSLLKGVGKKINIQLYQSTKNWFSHS
jgi:hypothetical protein